MVSQNTIERSCGALLVTLAVAVVATAAIGSQFETCNHADRQTKHCQQDRGRCASAVHNSSEYIRNPKCGHCDRANDGSACANESVNQVCSSG